MKRITKILSLIGITLLSTNTLADDINILTVNRMDIATAADSDSARPMVLFLVDNSVTVTTTDGGDGLDCDGTGTGIWNPEFSSDFPKQYSTHDVNPTSTQYGGQINLGDVCSGNSSSGSRIESKSPIDVIKLVLKKRRDLKIGVQVLNDSKKATEILALQHYADLENCDDDNDAATPAISCMAAIDAIASVTTEKMPLLGGLEDIEDDLNDADSPLDPANECSSLELIIIANGGWKDDLNTDFATNRDALIALASDFKDKKIYKGSDGNTVNSNCGGVTVSIFGYNAAIPVNDTAIAPLFSNFSVGTSVAQAMTAENAGGGVAKNSASASVMASDILGYLDYNYPKATTLVTPSSPVSISRSSSLDKVVASAFKPSSKTIWSGNLQYDTVANWKAGQANPINANGSLNYGFIQATRGDLYLSGANALTPLAANDTLSTQDIAWLKRDLPAGFGDPIHFKPLAIDYGGDSNAHNVYTIIGTNHGVLHMFDSNGVEQWSILPTEVQKLIPALRNGNKAANYAMVDHLYGIDGAPSVFIYDADKDGKIDSGDGDRVLLYFGLRRGGASTIALDITNPESPAQLWKHGQMDLDYGPNYVAEDNKIIENNPPVDLFGGCMVIAIRSLQSGISGGILEQQGTDWYTKGTNELVLDPSNMGETGQNIFALVPLETDGTDLTRWTQKQNHCHYDLTEFRSFAFKSNPIATYGLLGHSPTGVNPHQCGNKDSLTRGMAVGMSSATGELKSVVGFGLNALPDGAIITSAKLRLSHYDADIQYNNTDPSEAYSDHIFVNATMGVNKREEAGGCRSRHYTEAEIDDASHGGSCGAYFGVSSSLDSYSATGYTEGISGTGDCSDDYDPGRRRYIAKIKDPLPSSAVAADYKHLGVWAEAVIYSEEFFPGFYDAGELNAKGMYALTSLYREEVNNSSIISECGASDDPAAKYINDKVSCLAWAQFKLSKINATPYANVAAAYNVAALGPLDEDWKYQPELVLTWKLLGELKSEELTAYNTIKSAFNGKTPSQSDALLSGNATCIASPTSDNCALPAGFPE